MLTRGSDSHTRFQQTAMLHLQTGELVECQPEHENGEAGLG